MLDIKNLETLLMMNGLISVFAYVRFLPLPVLRALGVVLGWVLYALMRSRRHTVRVNLQLCFAHELACERERKVRQVFVLFMQSWLDRFWLWHSSPATLARRLRIVYVQGQSEQGLAGCVLFAPHFVGMDAGWTALNTQTAHRYATIYSKQKNAAVDAWVRTGRARALHPPLLIEHLSSVRAAVQALRRGDSLYLLPDMNYEPDDSFFLPFFGNTAATLPVLPRYARLGQVPVVPVLTRLTHWGYEVQVLPALEHYPSGKTQEHLQADCLRMNQLLEQWINTMPTQYYWVHRRFKDQPRDAQGVAGVNPYDDLAGYKAAAQD